MKAATHDVRKYAANSALLASSAALGWSTLPAEVRSHGITERPAFVSPFVEICLVLDGNPHARVERVVAGLLQSEPTCTGSIWLTSALVPKAIAVTGPVPRTMHLYLPQAPFERLKDVFDVPAAPMRAIRNVAGIEDEVIHQIGRSILAELTAESAAGRVYVEAATLTLAARLLHKYADADVVPPGRSPLDGLEPVRLRRVVDFIATHLQDTITLEQMAAVAGYSAYHFARLFAASMGVPPHRYLSLLRLESAMAQLSAGKLSLVEIALNATFSSQASFTRAFHRATGMTPKQYRRLRLMRTH